MSLMINKKDINLATGGLTPLGWTKLVIMITIALVVAGVVILVVYDFNSTSEDYVEVQSELAHIDFDSKAKFFKEYEARLDNKIKQEGTNSITSNSSVNVKGDGQLITDASKNPVGVPMYDGYTMSGDYFDIDYSKFHGTSYANSHLHGLGDFTDSNGHNSVSYEFSSDDPASKKPEGSGWVNQDPTLKEMGGYWTVDGRMMVALPPGAMIDESIYIPMIPTHWANEAKYTDNSSWTGGAPALSYINGIFDNSLVGMYVDCVLDDGTVLAFITTDSKALHKGVYKGRELCTDSLMEGYAHQRCHLDGRVSYNGILEVCVTKERSKAFDPKVHLNLAGHKIVSFRVYKDIRHFTGKNQGFVNHFTDSQ